MNHLILSGHDLFKDCGFTYFVCGGYSLEMFVGETTRKHLDFDISIFEENKRDVVTFLQSHGWQVFMPARAAKELILIADANDKQLDDCMNMWAIKPGANIVPTHKEGAVYQYNVLAIEQKEFNFIEICVDIKEGDNFVWKHGGITRQLDKAILYKDGIPYMAPEVVLLLKSPQFYSTDLHQRTKTPVDYKAVLPLLPEESRQWLMAALDKTYPDGYSWLLGLPQAATLYTERLMLRRFTTADEQPYADIMANPNVYRYLGTGQGIPRENIGRMIESWEGTWGHGLGVYAVVERESGKLIGHCGVRGLPCGRKEILYAYCDTAWGKGYATEAAKAVLQAHDTRPLVAVSYPENPASIGVIKKLGFRHVGQEMMFGKMLESFVLA